jgi:hypothetical protein
MRQDAPERLTTTYDHFEPARAAGFWSEMKRRLVSCGRLTQARASALDFKILSNVHSLMRLSRRAEARTLAKNISWEGIKNYEWYRLGSFAWFCKHGGTRWGAESFVTINRILGR